MDIEIETLSHNFEVVDKDGASHYSGPSIELAAAMRRQVEGGKIIVKAQVSLNENTAILLQQLNEQEG